MRKYYKTTTNRPYAQFNILKETRADKRYFGSSFSNYYTEERGEIRERWKSELDCNSNLTDRKCFALLRRCYALGMLIVNGVDLRSAYSCLRANTESVWEKKIMKLLGSPLNLSKLFPTDETPNSTQTLILNLYQLNEIKVINPLPEIVWRDETEDYYWIPHQYSNFVYNEKFDEYVDGELLATLTNRRSKKLAKQKAEANTDNTEDVERFFGGKEIRR